MAPLRPFADGYLAHLVEHGYALRTAQLEPQFVAHVSRSLAATGRDLSGLRPEAAEEFVAERRRLGYATRLTPKVTLEAKPRHDRTTDREVPATA